MRCRDVRLPSDRDLRVVYDGQTFLVPLLNISPSGARLGKLGTLPHDAILALCHLHISIQARVAWSSDTETGVRFTIPLCTGDMNVFRGTVALTSDWGNSSHQRLREMA